MVRVDANEFAEKWSRRLKASLEDIRKGVEKVNEAPSKKAIAKKEKFKQRLIEAIDSGRWERALEKVTLEDWKRAMIQKGLSRIASGVDEATPKMQAFGEALLKHIEAGLKQIEGMPDLTLEDNINRMVAFIRHMAKFRWK